MQAGRLGLGRDATASRRRSTLLRRTTSWTVLRRAQQRNVRLAPADRFQPEPPMIRAALSTLGSGFMGRLARAASEDYHLRPKSVHGKDQVIIS